jgi:hypothetical protein
MPSQDNLPKLITAWQTGGISVANAVACGFTPGCSTGTVVAGNDTLGGSNGWAIAPSKSASSTPQFSTRHHEVVASYTDGDTGAVPLPGRARLSKPLPRADGPRDGNPLQGTLDNLPVCTGSWHCHPGIHGAA